MNDTQKPLIVVPWHNPAQLAKFLDGWGVEKSDSRIVFQQDCTKAGCSRTKNAGIERALELGAEAIIVLDDDCIGCKETPTIDALIDGYIAALQPQPVRLFETVTEPQSRGTPFFQENHFVTMPVAGVMGYWTNIGDYDAPSQLVYGATHPMKFKQETIFGRYFAWSGMACSFRREWWPIAQFIDVARFDDIWAGFLFQKIAYSRGHCFNLNGPLVWHSRQSAVFQNLREESKWLENNEALWQKIHECPSNDYATLRKLLPV